MGKPNFGSHKREMEILRSFHEKVMSDDDLRGVGLVRSGLFVRRADGKLEVSKMHEQLFTKAAP